MYVALRLRNNVRVIEPSTTMVYQSTSRPSVPQTTEAVAQLLCEEIDDARLQFRGQGYTGKVHQLSVRDRTGRDVEFVVKGVTNDQPLRLYQEVLAPYDLNSPAMYGLFDGGDGLYVLMEYIPHDPPDWRNPTKYRLVIDWLVRKDTITNSHEHDLLERPYIERFDLGDFDARIEPVRQAVCDELDSSIRVRLLSALENGHERFAHAARQVRRGPQVLTHNDLQMLNVLFGAGPRRGELYVVDWTQPAIGTGCIDLATLLMVAPRTIRLELTRRYRAAISIDGFDEIFAAAHMHVSLSMLRWTIDAIRSGHRHAVHRDTLNQLTNTLMHYFG